MKSRLPIVIAAAIVAGFVACFAWALGFFEPRYDGQPASVYLRSLLEQDRFGGREDKQKILAVPSHVGVPILVRFTKAQDPRWRGWYQRLYPKLPQFITRRLGPPKSNASAVQRAVMALGYYGPDAHRAVPQLLNLEATAKSQLLQNAAIYSLGEIGPGASNAIPMLITHFQSRSPSAAAPAVLALGKIDSRGERSGALLVAALENGYMQHSYYAEGGPLGALGRMAANEPKWIEEIWRLTESSLKPNSLLNPGFVSRGAARLHTLNALDASRVKLICSHSERDEPSVRQSIAEALAFATEHANTTIPILLKFRADTNTYVSAIACRTLLGYAQNTNVNVQLRVTAIRSVLSCVDDGNKWQALATVQKLGPVAASALGEIVPLLSDKNERIRGKAAETIIVLKPAAAWAKSALEAARDDKWGFVRDAVEVALRDMASEHSQP